MEIANEFRGKEEPVDDDDDDGDGQREAGRGRKEVTLIALPNIVCRMNDCMEECLLYAQRVIIIIIDMPPVCWALRILMMILVLKIQKTREENGKSEGGVT